ncbi:hypothetical protein RJ55_06416 [Drechmeria coniospora]|nr:hypothetical protein RJ55_06416 [Drechmeria coniospora]
MPLFAVALGLLVGIGFRRGQGTDPERGSVHGWPRCARGDDGWASLYPGPKPKRQPPGGPDDEENSGNGRKWASKVNLVLSCRRMPCEASECASGFASKLAGRLTPNSNMLLLTGHIISDTAEERVPSHRRRAVTEKPCCWRR